MFMRLHRDIELFLNGKTVITDTVEFRTFEQFLQEQLIPRGWIPFRTEWSIYDEDATSLLISVSDLCIG